MDYSSASYDFDHLMSRSEPDLDFESYINATTRGRSGNPGRIDVEYGTASEVVVAMKVEPSEPEACHAHNDDTNGVNDDDVEVLFEVSEEYDPNLLVEASFSINESTWGFMKDYNQADFSSVTPELFDGLDFEMEIPIPDDVSLYGFDREEANCARLGRRCHNSNERCEEEVCPKGRYRRMYGEFALTQLAVEVAQSRHVAA